MLRRRVVPPLLACIAPLHRLRSAPLLLTGKAVRLTIYLQGKAETDTVVAGARPGVAAVR